MIVSDSELLALYMNDNEEIGLFKRMPTMFNEQQFSATSSVI